jgi:hypothetical protein
MCGRSTRITTTHHIDIHFAGAMSTDQWLTLTFVASLERTNHCTWQQVLIKKRDKLRKTGILCGESERYTDLNRERTVLI